MDNRYRLIAATLLAGLLTGTPAWGQTQTSAKTTIGGSVYGGGALANTGNTEVNLHGGVIEHDVYGGGKGQIAVPEVKDDDGNVVTAGVAAVEAQVANALVTLNGTVVQGEDDTKTYPDNCVVKGSIFGCNNLNGSPQGTVTVHVYKTAPPDGQTRTAEEALTNKDAEHTYDLAAVYGGGNLAAYVPDASIVDTAAARVIIDGCDLTSIRQVYGGGNAASTPATEVTINGTYEIEEVFGGGNGKDAISRDGGITSIQNPGANVGFKDYWDYENNKDLSAYDTKEKRQAADFVTNYTYGSGTARVNINGGTIHSVYGGSNTKGNVREVAVAMLEHKTVCDFKVDEAYGGGKSAPMDGEARLIMQCIPGLDAIYGGAQNADVFNDVTLTITNGTYGRVFGGNNIGGTIHGTITVNVEETGCHPVIIGQLYGGGNQAAYAAPDGKAGPTINIRSCTAIGDVFGGGYGSTAVVTGDTHVNINEAIVTTEDEHAKKAYAGATMTFEDVDSEGDTVKYSVTIPDRPASEAGAIGAIGNVYGGGNNANVEGNTHVNIGTETAGADIRGNVYGGGNNADVTGQTFVTVGQAPADDEAPTTPSGDDPTTPDGDDPTPTPTP